MLSYRLLFTSKLNLRCKNGELKYTSESVKSKQMATFPEKRKTNYLNPLKKCPENEQESPSLPKFWP